MLPEPTAAELAAAVAKEAGDELDECLATIRHCLDQLTDAQVWWRPDDSLNSVGNLMLHLGGNVRQWITAGVGGADDVRRRPEEFAERGPIARAELFGRLTNSVDEAKTALRTVTPTGLLAGRRIQGFDVTGLQAIFESVAHFKGHTQEIVHLTRCQLGSAYRFALVL